LPPRTEGDPTALTVTFLNAPVRDPGMPLSFGDGHTATEKPVMPSAYWGDLQIWDTRVNNHNIWLCLRGKAFADGWSEPSLQKAG